MILGTKHSPILKFASTAFAVLLVVAGASAEIEEKAFAFGGSNGAYPYGGVILDSAGNLYGTTEFGGKDACPSGCGVAFRLTPHAKGGATEKVLHGFAGDPDGANPAAGLLLDDAGNLYGTTYKGGNTAVCGNQGCGVVFELTHDSHDQWTENVIYTFTGGTDGGSPLASLVSDAAGNLYGTAFRGGDTNCALGCGVVFEMSRNSAGGWAETVLYSFSGLDGAQPISSLIFDGAGNLYGTTYSGGDNNLGTAYELMPAAASTWREQVLYSFGDGTGSGYYPSAALTLDAYGNLYGTTPYGGNLLCMFGCGVVFELTRAFDGQWTETLLHVFQGGSDGAQPSAPVIFDVKGDLYGTAAGGDNCCSVVFQLRPGADGQWTNKTVGLAEGAEPFAGVIFNSAGNLYGTTSGGYNLYSDGTVFQLSGADFDH